MIRALLFDFDGLIVDTESPTYDATRLGLLTAIVTRNTDEWVAGHCGRVGLAHGWDAILCANEEPTMDKAGLYRRAVDVLGLSPAEAIAIEDSPAGVAAARDAGIFCVAVPNEITRAASFDGADLVLGSLAELRLESLLQSIRRSPRPSAPIT